MNELFENKEPLKDTALGRGEKSLSGEEQLYLDLFNLVKYSFVSLDKIKIENTIDQTIEVFLKDPFSKLLFYSYTVSKENYLIAHITNNVILSVAFGRSLGLNKNDLLDLGMCAFGHDFGMAEYIPLFQKVHELTEEENKVIQNHPLKSAEMFKSLFPEKIINGILDIHECVNGQGYPSGKTDQDISPLAKIVSVCDIFIALTHPRNYRQEYTPYEAMKVIIRKNETVFDRRVVKKFLEFISIYPVGSLVYLNTGETALVISSNPGLPTRSIIQVLLSAKREVEASHKIINLGEDNMLYILGPVERKEEKEILSLLKPRGDFNL